MPSALAGFTPPGQMQPGRLGHGVTAAFTLATASAGATSATGATASTLATPATGVAANMASSACAGASAAIAFSGQSGLSFSGQQLWADAPAVMKIATRTIRILFMCIVLRFMLRFMRASAQCHHPVRWMPNFTQRWCSQREQERLILPGQQWQVHAHAQGTHGQRTSAPAACHERITTRPLLRIARLGRCLLCGLHRAARTITARGLIRKEGAGISRHHRPRRGGE